MKNQILILVVFCGVFNISDAQRRHHAVELVLDSLKDGMKVTITGVAKDAKMAAAILTDSNEVVYIDKLHSWNQININKRMRVTGVVKIVDCPPEGLYNEYGQLNQYAIGRHIFLKHAVWIRVR